MPAEAIVVNDKVLTGRWFRVDAAARELGIGRRAVLDAVRRQTLPHVWLSKRLVLIDVDALHERAGKTGAKTGALEA